MCLWHALSASQDMKVARCRPEAATHSAMIATYVGAGMWEAAYAQLLDMQEEGIQPPVHALCLLLSLCARRARWVQPTGWRISGLQPGSLAAWQPCAVGRCVR